MNTIGSFISFLCIFVHFVTVDNASNDFLLVSINGIVPSHRPVTSSTAGHSSFSIGVESMSRGSNCFSCRSTVISRKNLIYRYCCIMKYCVTYNRHMKLVKYQPRQYYESYIFAFICLFRVWWYFAFQI